MRKFLTSVADVYAYDDSENLLFMAKTLLDSSVEVSLGSTPIRGGQGNQLQYIYYHTGEMNFKLTEAQWNLALLASTTGQSTGTGSNIYAEENVQLTRATPTGTTVTGTVTGTPIASGSTATIYGWFETDYQVANGLPPYRGTFSGTAFTCSNFSADDTLATLDYVCIRYYNLDSGATELVIPSNMIPSSVKLVMETQLNSSDVSTNQIGTVQIIAPKVQLSGAFTISMTADGVSNTPLTGMALSTLPVSGNTPCSSVPYYARIVENITSVNWYDDVFAISVAGGDIELEYDGTTTPAVWAIPSDPTKSAFLIGHTLSNEYLTFTEDLDPDTCVLSVGEFTGLITAAASANAGTATIGIAITDKPSVNTQVTVTVPVP